MPRSRRKWSFKKVWRKARPALVRGVAIAVALVALVPPVLVGVTAYSQTPVLVLQSIMHRGTVSQIWLPLTEISPHLRHAVIAAEDSKFCSHRGFDWDAIESAWAFNQNGDGKRGASTISMQTAKNVFLWPDRSWVRKGFEAYFTVLIELMWTKEQILERYLNVVEWGVGVYGAEAAARHHFGKSATWLNRRESARLAAILPSPRKWRANPPGQYVAQRASVLMRRMAVVADGHARCVT